MLSWIVVSEAKLVTALTMESFNPEINFPVKQ